MPVKTIDQAVLVGGGDDFLVAHRAAGLDHGRGAGLGHHVEAVAEGEEGIGGDHRAGQRQAGVLRLDRGDARASRRGSSGRRRRRAVRPLPQKTMAFDLTYLATRQANSRSRISASVGCAW